MIDTDWEGDKIRLEKELERVRADLANNQATAAEDNDTLEYLIELEKKDKEKSQEEKPNILLKDSPENNSTDNTKTNLENKNNQPLKAVGNGNNGKKIDKVDNSISLGLLKEGSQEQKSQLETLKNQIASLQNQHSSLQNKFS
ncbi:15381_t:CDS:2 [Gigaspora rosea]|nr:15381_t:CDS:2 [Gigaspora rosea]